MDEAEGGHRRVGPGLALAALWVIGAVVYAVLGQQNDIPSISPDEFSYGHLARSIADGEGLAWRGISEPMRAALYVYAIAPAWLGSSTTTAFAVSKVLGAVMATSVVVPVWLLARRSVGPALALVPAGLAIAGTWMLVSSSIITENLAYPLGVAALAAMVVAVQRPLSRWLWIALGLAALAMLSRAQLAVLIAVLPLAALADAARHGRGELRAGLDRQRRTLLVGAGLALAGLIIVLVAPSVLGNYEGVQSSGGGLGAFFASAGRHAVGLAAMAGLAPAILVLTFTIQRASWADDEVGPLLAVFWTATLILITQVAWYMAGGDREWHIERYVMYVLPLGMTIIVAGAVRTRPGWKPMLAVTVVLSALMLLAAPMRNVTEEEGVWGVLRPVHAVFGTSTPVSLAIAMLLVGLVAVALAHRDSRRAAGAGAVLAGMLAALTVGVFIVQDVAVWTWRIDVLGEVRKDRPKDLRWLDRAAGGPIGRIAVESNTRGAQTTDFFNRDIAQVYVPDPALGVVSGPVIRGRTCQWNVTADGTLNVGLGCGPIPKRFLLDDPVAKLTFADQRVVSRQRDGARLVEVGEGVPRLRSLVFVQCTPREYRVNLGADGIPRKGGRHATCAPGIRGNLWVDRAGTLEMRFAGGQADHQVAAGGKVFPIPAGRTTTVKVPVPANPTAFEFQLDWEGNGPEFPELQSIDLVQGPTRTPLM
jgi:hypothetical protein